MKRIGTWQYMNALQRLQWLFALSAILFALCSVAGIHHHEDGLHTAQSHCVSCDLEDITTHGALIGDYTPQISNPGYSEPISFVAVAVVRKVATAAAIRAPPLNS